MPHLSRAGVLLVLALGACPYVPEGEIRVEQGALPVGPGETVSFALYCDRLFGGWELSTDPAHCGMGYWQVQQQPGGSPELGTIRCGQYTAPTTRPPEPPLIGGAECNCTDACGASLILSLDGYPAP